MSETAVKAARAVLRDFSELEKLQVSRKGTADFVTAADTKSEKIIREGLARARPDFGFLGEEGGETLGVDRNHRWIIDPIDGTTNFMHGIPHFAITFALEFRGEVTAGIVLDPVKNEEYFAEKGRGAFMNGVRLRVSGRNDPTQALAATGIPFAGCEGHAQYMRELLHIMPKVAGIRRFGAAALDLAYVASGRFEVYWENGIKLWDAAAGALLVREAGGKVSDLSGGDDYPQAGILAGNPHMHAALLKEFKALRAG